MWTTSAVGGPSTWAPLGAFEGQTKTKLGNPGVKRAIDDAVFEPLRRHFLSNVDDLGRARAAGCELRRPRASHPGKKRHPDERQPPPKVRFLSAGGGGLLHLQ